MIKPGSKVLFPIQPNPGHDPEPSMGLVTQVWPDGSVRIKGSPAIWPASRIKHIPEPIPKKKANPE